MFRLVLLPIILFAISTICLDTCTAQTFQYSRGWTNGKRSSAFGSSLNQQQQPQIYLQKDDNAISTALFDDPLLERCLLHMRNLLGRSALYTSGFSLKPTPTNSNSNNNVDNNNNNLFSSHHQSSELFDELNGGMETNDYGKH